MQRDFVPDAHVDRALWRSRLDARSHPARATLSREMHARALPPITGPSRVLQFVFMVSREEAQNSLILVDELLAKYDRQAGEGDRFRAAQLGELRLLWERHTEFVTYTFVASTGDIPLFDLTPFEPIASWISEVPGIIIRSTHICVVDAALGDAEIIAQFAFDDLIISDVAQGKARIWSDFRLHSDGFGHLLIQNKGLTGAEAPQVVQRLQELGNYRKIALLGLPDTQRATPELDDLEHRLTAITGHIADPAADPEKVLEDLSALSATLAQIIARTRYRMSATRAYAELCLDRIRRLSVSPIDGFRSLDDFTERRLLPAMRSCDAFTRRLDDLAQRAAWNSALLRTRIDTALARRNRDLLASMNNRTALQLRLQHTVEGLSVVAVSYYVLGLYHYLLGPLAEEGLLPPNWFNLAVIPIVIVSVWIATTMLTRSTRRPRDTHMEPLNPERRPPARCDAISLEARRQELDGTMSPIT